MPAEHALTVDELLEQARLNEEKLLELQTMELRILHAQSLLELLHVLVHDYRQRFNLCVITLNLFDPDGQIEQSIKAAKQHDDTRSMAKTVLAHSFFTQTYDAPNALPNHVALSPLTEWHEGLFGQFAEDIESIALIPLTRQGERLGFLGLGSVDPNRYHPDMASDFLSRLGSIVSVCLQNMQQMEQMRTFSTIDADSQLPNQRGWLDWFERTFEHASEQQHELFFSATVIDIRALSDPHKRLLRTQFFEHIHVNLSTHGQLSRPSKHRLLITHYCRTTSAAAEATKALTQIIQTWQSQQRNFPELFLGHGYCNPSDTIAEPSVLAQKLLTDAENNLQTRSS